MWVESNKNWRSLQKKLKKDFVIMNQVSRQNAKTDVENFFFLING